eukprot:TRINITY_DN10083_c0_g1_i1.p1 TRINITY_DN10083_c0_g1~~TRINITY_DN10083_c0_g1_i1.p1  ORF type:complete len:510 (+),score=128.79 TRINITY_DN10083_c0_g1_i1:55-1584(+)
MGDLRWLLGASLNICGSVIINLGTNIIKLSHNKKSRTLWWAGMGTFAAGNIANFSSFSFAAQSLLAALGSVQFVTNLILATIFLGEKVTTRIIIGTVAIVIGNILAVAFGNRDSEQYTASELMDLYGETAFIVYLSFALPFSVGMNYVYRKLISDEKLHPVLSSNRESLKPLTYAASSASVGCLSVLFAKSSSQLLFQTFAGDNQLDKFFTYILVFLFICLTVFWLIRMNRALSQFDALIIVPQLQVFWTTFSIMSGGIYFKEFDSFTAAQFFWFVFGVLIVLCGVYFVCSRKEKVEIRQSFRRSRRQSMAPTTRDSHTEETEKQESEQEPDAPEDEQHLETRRRAISSAFVQSNLFPTYEINREGNNDDWAPNQLWTNIRTMIPAVAPSAPIASVDAKWAHDEGLFALSEGDEQQRLLASQHPRYYTHTHISESDSVTSEDATETIEMVPESHNAHISAPTKAVTFTSVQNQHAIVEIVEAPHASNDVKQTASFVGDVAGSFESVEKE